MLLLLLSTAFAQSTAFTYQGRLNEDAAPTNAPLSLELIAQEAQPLFHEMVGEGKDGMKTLAYGELVPVTIRSIQELDQKLESQAKQKEAEIQV